MPQYEYKRIFIPPMGTERYENDVNTLGDEGWDVHHIERTKSGGINAYLKRIRGMYRISQEEYDYIKSQQEMEPSAPCQLCGYLFNKHHEQCPAHEDNREKYGLMYCYTCGWIYDNLHTNERCDGYVEEESE